MVPVTPEGLNPMENYVILKELFRFCSVEDLKVCRQVSNLWKSTSLEAWRSSTQVAINTSDNMSLFLELVQNENSNHFISPFVSNYTLSYGETEQRFWELCGNSIKELTLEGYRFQSLDDFHNAIYVFCPNLEHLTLEYVNLLEGGGSLKEDFSEVTTSPNKNLKSLWLAHSESFVSWLDLLSHFPSPETLRLNRHMPAKNVNDVFSALSLMCERNPGTLKLKHIFCPLFSDNPSGKLSALKRVLKGPGLVLATLALHIVDQGDSTDVKEILRVQASSLRKLVLLGSEPIDSIALFPSHSQAKLVNLHELEFNWGVFTSMTFLNFTPKLKKLAIKHNKLSWRLSAAELSQTGVRGTDCTDLNIIFGTRYEWIHVVDYLRHLKYCFPNLKKLALSHVGNEEFAMICKLWPDFVTLTMYMSSVDDTGITGMDQEDVQRINEEGENGTWRPVTVPRANITALKGLQRLFVYSLLEYNIEFGYCSTLYGFKILPQLRYSFARS